QPEGAAAATLRRLQNEMQMILYTLPVNDLRSKAIGAARLPLINSNWLHGTGELTDANQREAIHITGPRSLADAALREDWTAWAQAWRQLDATVCADLLKQLQTQGRATLTLCGERSAFTYGLQSKSGFERIKGNFRVIFGLQPANLLPKQL
ncbi:MAG: hypothetical protein Q7R40_14235, partial [Phaeospirillum sp.]|nr:hypothetical protein [Phaeospirillum sp.]